MVLVVVVLLMLMLEPSAEERVVGLGVVQEDLIALIDDLQNPDLHLDLSRVAEVGSRVHVVLHNPRDVLVAVDQAGFVAVLPGIHQHDDDDVANLHDILRTVPAVVVGRRLSHLTRVEANQLPNLKCPDSCSSGIHEFQLPRGSYSLAAMTTQSNRERG